MTHQEFSWKFKVCLVQGGATPVTKEWIVYNRMPGSSKQRRVCHFFTLGFGQNFGTHNSNFDNNMRGLLERVYIRKGFNGEYVRPNRPLQREVEELLPFRRLVTILLPSTPPMTRDEFAGSYRGRKQKIYLRAVESLRVRPVRKSDSYLSSFIKVEKVNFTAKPDPPPRLIQPRSPRFNVEVGRYLKPLEHSMYRAIDKVFREPTVAKGLNAVKRGRIIADKWRKFVRPVAIPFDASRFDQSISTPLLKYEHGFYQQDNRLQRLLAWQLVNRGYLNTPDGRIKYQVAGSRMSGDMNTAMGNVILMCAMMWTYFDQHAPTCKYSLFNDGDDCVVIVERRYEKMIIDTLPRVFEKWGIMMKVEGTPAYKLEHVDFCQCRPVLTHSGYVMVRDPRITLFKDSITFKPINTRTEYINRIKEVAASGVALNSGIPVTQEYFRMMAQFGLATEVECETGMQYLAVGMEAKFREILPETRLSFEIAFGIPVTHQYAIESEIRKVTLQFETPVPVDQIRSLPLRLPIDHLL